MVIQITNYIYRGKKDICTYCNDRIMKTLNHQYFYLVHVFNGRLIANFDGPPSWF